jgi:hypothetical protein
LTFDIQVLAHLEQSRKEKQHSAQSRKSADSYLHFIKDSQRFYRQLLLDMDILCGGISLLHEEASKWKEYVGQEPTKGAPDPARKPPAVDSESGQRWAQFILVWLGDLSRWRAQDIDTGNRDWRPAVGYYDLAHQVYPISATPYLGLSNIEIDKKNWFMGLYYTHRGLSSEDLPSGTRLVFEKNLTILMKEIGVAYQSRAIFKAMKDAYPAPGESSVLSWYLGLHSKMPVGNEIPNRNSTEREILTQLKTQIQNKSVRDTVLFKMILINIAAQDVAESHLAGAQKSGQGVYPLKGVNSFKKLHFPADASSV